MSVELLQQDLKSGSLRRFYYIYGEESYLKRFYLESLKEAVLGATGDLNFWQCDGKQASAEAFADFMDRFPAFGGRKFALLTDVPLNSDLGVYLVKHPEVFNDDTVVAVFADALAYDLRTKDAKAFLATVAEYGLAVQVDLPSDTVLQSWVMQHCRKMGTEIGLPEAQYFLGITEKNMDFMIRELQKLCAYCDGKVSRKDIDTVCVRTVETDAFALSNAIVAKDARLVAEILERLKRNRTPAQMTLGSLYSTVAKLYKGKLVAMYGGDAKPYYYYRHVIQAKPLAVFSRMVTFCTDIDRAMKRGAGDEDVLLAELAMGLVALL